MSFSVRGVKSLPVFASVLAVLMTCSAVVVGGPLGASPADAQSSRLVVNSNSDDSDADLTDGVCQTEQGDCSLRAAIEQANARGGGVTIDFSLPTSAAIAITKPLVIDGTAITIDGYSQPGSSANTLRSGSNAVIGVEIDATTIAGSETNGIVINGQANTIRGIAIWGAYRQILLTGEGADGNVVVGNFIGTNAAATFMSDIRRVGVGIRLGPDRNQIGRPTVEDRNVISGNGSHGVLIDHGETSENRIQNNIVGPSPLFERNLGSYVGIDVQWWSWGNLIGGLGDLEGNVVSGNWGTSGIDLSHGATNNFVMGNLVGTLGDGVTTTDWSGNNTGIVIKDGASNNYLERNVVGASAKSGLWVTTNYSHGNVFVENYFGATPYGPSTSSVAIPNGDAGILPNGYDQVFYRNVMANNGLSGVAVLNSVKGDTYLREPSGTRSQQIHESTLFLNSRSPEIVNGSRSDAYPVTATPVITQVGNGDIQGNVTDCQGCRIEVYVSGTLQADATLDTASSEAGIGAAWITSASTNESGQFSIMDEGIKPGKQVYVLAIHPSHGASDLSEGHTVPTLASETRSDFAPLDPVARPVRPALPPLYERSDFTCSFGDGTLQWTDMADGATYYVFSETNGNRSYHGGQTSVSMSIRNAESYEVEFWGAGYRQVAECLGGPVEVFACSYIDGTLQWTGADADRYYLFAYVAEEERYLGGHESTQLATPPADRYEVEYWEGGTRIFAQCEGPGEVAFTCSFDDGVLSWSDQSADTYYVHAYTGEEHRYLGGHQALQVDALAADRYEVEHWVGGHYVARCTATD